MIRYRNLVAGVGLFLMVLLAACAPSRDSKVYSRDQAQRAMSVYYGTVLRISEVTIEGEQSGKGALAGGAMGGALGSGVGSGSGKTIAVVGGAIAGAIAGSAIEKGVTTEPALEIEVELDSGEILVVVQGKDDVYRVGDRVRVVKDPRGNTRVRQ